jgi:hypothetical protein
MTYENEETNSYENAEWTGPMTLLEDFVPKTPFPNITTVSDLKVLLNKIKCPIVPIKRTGYISESCFALCMLNYNNHLMEQAGVRARARDALKAKKAATRKAARDAMNSAVNE